MWFLRRMGKINLKQKLKNEVVLKNLKTEKSRISTIKARELIIFGHTKCHDSIIKKNLEGKAEGRSPRDRPRA